MKIEKLELRLSKTNDYRYNDAGDLIKMEVYDADIKLNKKIIKSWIAGMNKIEMESFSKLLSEAMEPDEEGKELNEAGQVVLDYLNRMTGKKIRARNSKGHATAQFKLILDRLKDNYTINDLSTVIDRKLKDPWFIQNHKYMTPTTLFRASSFERYVNEK